MPRRLFRAASTALKGSTQQKSANYIFAVEDVIWVGSAVFDHLFKLPPRYFEHRPTGVIAARLPGVEAIREFVRRLIS